MGTKYVDRARTEQAADADLEPWQVMDLLELIHDLGVQVQQLEEAVRSHGRIGIATGLVMAQHHIEADDAFTVLSRASQDSNRKLRDIAEEVISSGRLLQVPVRRRHAGADIVPVAADGP